ncbi:unnamed protein product [Prorocentrum cordatum]|uniref:SAM domain-containing protein n=1 Tax=Prorocentrum cordatum TaxID=2364126 RepID=A0ABN9VDT1_9DINO|nr:unnamed protein product [Polarella glacialis]
MPAMDLVHPGWPAAQLAQWLRLQGGVSDEALAEMENLGFGGELWYAATEADFRNEEMGLEEPDVARLMQLHAEHSELLRAASSTRDEPAPEGSAATPAAG